MSLNELFSSSLRLARESAGISQETLASLSGLDRTYISQLERGLKSPTLTTLEKLGGCLSMDPRRLLREASDFTGPRVPRDYIVRDDWDVSVARANERVAFPGIVLTSAVNVAHDLIDDLYAAELDIAGILGLRNLSAFIGELVAAAIVKTGDELFRANPHQDGYPDLLLMDSVGRSRWDELSGMLDEKPPFSPFSGGGVEVKATCGSVPTPRECRKRRIPRPGNGDLRIGCMKGYDWKAHHRETNNLVGVLWDFIDRRPRIAAMFYCNDLREEDWGRIVQPRQGGGRTTSVSIMSRSGLSKMYDGWLCVLAKYGYREFLNARNRSESIPVSE